MRRGQRRRADRIADERWERMKRYGEIALVDDGRRGIRKKRVHWYKDV